MEKLPVEIRLQIFKLLIPTNRVFMIAYNGRSCISHQCTDDCWMDGLCRAPSDWDLRQAHFKARVPIHLARVSRLFAKECLHLLYANNSFVVNNTTSCKEFLVQIGSANSKRITRLTVGIRLYQHTRAEARSIVREYTTSGGILRNMTGLKMLRIVGAGKGVWRTLKDPKRRIFDTDMWNKEHHTLVYHMVNATGILSGGTPFCRTDHAVTTIYRSGYVDTIRPTDEIEVEVHNIRRHRQRWAQQARASIAYYERRMRQITLQLSGQA